MRALTWIALRNFHSCYNKTYQNDFTKRIQLNLYRRHRNSHQKENSSQQFLSSKLLYKKEVHLKLFIYWIFSLLQVQKFIETAQILVINNGNVLRFVNSQSKHTIFMQVWHRWMTSSLPRSGTPTLHWTQENW